MISAFWDEDASVWVESSDDVPGLVTKAGTIELLVAKLKLLIPDLLEANGILPKTYDSVPFHLHAGINYEREERQRCFLFLSPLRTPASSASLCVNARRQAVKGLVFVLPCIPVPSTVQSFLVPAMPG